MKYIDAERLIAEINKRLMAVDLETLRNFGSHRVWAYNDVKDLITSLQQEQPEVQNGKFVFPKYLYARTKDNKTIDMSYAPQDMSAIEYIRNDFVEQEQPENKEKIMNFFAAVGDCGFSQHDILLLNNIWKEAGCPPPKSQVAYASKMEQPEVDLEKEIMRYQREDMDRDTTVRDVAQHFAEWGAIHLQPEVDLGKDIDDFFDKWDRNSNGCFFDENGAVVTIKTIKGVVKHFLNARKEE